MGNWLKGRVLIIPENSQQGEQFATNAPNNYQVSARPDRQGTGSSASNHNTSRSELTYYTFSQPSTRHYMPEQHDMSSSSIYYPPYSSTLLQFATEEEQIQLAKRIGLIQHLPTGIYTECSSNGSTKTIRECVICMVEFSKGDSIRFLPCLHTYHVHCIDDWLMRSFICPSCMEPVDVALLNTL